MFTIESISFSARTRTIKKTTECVDDKIQFAFRTYERDNGTTTAAAVLYIIIVGQDVRRLTPGMYKQAASFIRREYHKEGGGGGYMKRGYHVPRTAF